MTMTGMRWLWLIIVLLVAGCAGPASPRAGDSEAEAGMTSPAGGAAPNEDAGVPGDRGSDAGAGDDGDPAEDVDASTGAPVTVTVDGITFEYNTGRCTVSEDEVHAEATDESFNGMRVEWRADDPDATRIIAQTPPPVMVLQAGPDFPDTTVDVTVDGSHVEISARMLDQLSNQFMGVVIRLDCTQEAFGPVPDVAGTASVEVAGETYVLDALDTCRITEDGVHVDKLAGQDGIAFSVTPDPGPGHTVALYLPDGGWVRGPGFIRDQPGVEFEVSGQRATWSGALTPLIGEEQPASITFECG